MNKTEVIAKFLELKSHSDLSDLYSHNMETQVNVHPGDGEFIEGVFNEKKWHGWTDGTQTWKPFRIPWKAYSDPEYTDSEMKFDLLEHADGIGMTGWDWKNRCSKWVAFDFDAILGHSELHDKKLTDTELQAVKDKAKELPWVTIRKSTSGSGIHLYVFLNDVPTANHTEHAALARSILGNMSALLGYDFVTKVDICGGNMWVWHRKMEGTDGLTLLKQGTVLKEPPRNWRDHVDVVKTSNRSLNKDVKDLDPFDVLFNQTRKVPLDTEHHRLVNWLNENADLWWWDADKHMLVTHVFHLRDAFEALDMRGHFQTMSKGRNLTEQNCFCFPMSNGAWSVRRFSRGVTEADSWLQDSAGWTKCVLNALPTFDVACKTYGGIEDDKGAFRFNKATDAKLAAKLMGRVISLSDDVKHREATLKPKKDGKVVVSIERKDTDQVEKGWLSNKNQWQQVINVSETASKDTEVSDVDHLIRHAIDQSGCDAGWVVQSKGAWYQECLNHVKFAMLSTGLDAKVMTNTLGAAILNPWKLVTEPFKPEYLGDRMWNKNAPQFTMPPSESETLNCPTWLSMLAHNGRGLDDAVLEDKWCIASGIVTGGQYLLAWVASMFQEVNEPLPYLFIYSKLQNTGKSTFHESLAMLMTDQGYIDASTALQSKGDFNGELVGRVLCYVEEKSLADNDSVKAKLKDWVTSRRMLLHPKRATPYMGNNTTHWIHVANNHDACPVFDGDTRITMIQAYKIENMVPKKEFNRLLMKEMSDFLAMILRYKIPPTNDRLRVPVVTTSIKVQVTTGNMNAIEEFLESEIIYEDGYLISFADFHLMFLETVDEADRASWHKKAVSKALPPEILKGKATNPNRVALFNVRWANYANVDKVAGRYALKQNGYAEVIRG